MSLISQTSTLSRDQRDGFCVEFSQRLGRAGAIFDRAAHAELVTQPLASPLGRPFLKPKRSRARLYGMRLAAICAAGVLSLGAQDIPKKKDPDQIGNRDVSKGINFYSIEKEIALGKLLAADVRRSNAKSRPQFRRKSPAHHRCNPLHRRIRREVKVQKDIQEFLKSQPQYVVTTSEFAAVKARLLALENRRDVPDPKRPTLRKAPEKLTQLASRLGD